ncbi:MAG: AAA family ATPase, partial [Nitrososphaera sp.]
MTFREFVDAGMSRTSLPPRSFTPGLFAEISAAAGSYCRTNASSTTPGSSSSMRGMDGACAERIDAIIRRTAGREKFWYKNKSSLNTSTIYHKVIGRNEEISKLVSFYSDYLNTAADSYDDESSGSGYFPLFVSVRGPSGTGKTLITYHLTHMLKGVESVMVDLHEATSPFSCLNLMLQELGLAATPSMAGNEKAISKLKEAIRNKLDEKMKERRQAMSRLEVLLFGSVPPKPAFVMVLDNFDELLQRSWDHHSNPTEVLTMILGLFESLQKDGYPVGIIAITNQTLENFGLEPKVLSRVRANVVDFAPYKIHEVHEIVDDRAKDAFHVQPPSRIIQLCATICCNEDGNARTAIDLLRKTADIAFQSGISPSGMNEQHFFAAKQELLDDSMMNVIPNLTPLGRKVAGAMALLIANTGDEQQSVTDIFRFCKMLSDGKKRSQIIATGGPDFEPRGYSTILQNLEELERKGVVHLIKTGGGRGKGVRTMCRLNAPADVVGRLALGHVFWDNLETARRKKQEYETCYKLLDTLCPPFSASKDVLKTQLEMQMNMLDASSLIGLK